MIRRALLRLEPTFHQSLKSCEDFHFYFRLARRTPVGVINKVGMLRRVHGRNMSGDALKMRTEGIRSRTMLRDTEENPVVRKDLNRYIANCNADLARFHADHGRFLESLQYDWRVLTGPLLWPETGKACRNLVRTIAVAAGLHRPAKSDHRV
jgi:hypothetical protein